MDGDGCHPRPRGGQAALPRPGRPAEEIRALAARRIAEGAAQAAAFALPRRLPGFGLAEAIAAVTRNPARATGLTDRGEIAPGLRADLVRVRRDGGVPVVRQVWRGGERVA